MRFMLKVSLTLAIASLQVIASPVAGPAAEPKPQDDVNAQFWHAVHEYTGDNCDGDLIEKYDGPFYFDVPLHDNANSVWLDNGWFEWHGFEDHSHPGGWDKKWWCNGTAYGRLIDGKTGCYNLKNNGHTVKCVGWFTAD